MTDEQLQELEAEIDAHVTALMQLVAPAKRPARDMVRRARGARTVSPKFVALLAGAVERDAQLRTTYPLFDPAGAKTMLQRRLILKKAAIRIEVLLRTVNRTLELEYAAVTADALLAFKMIQRYAIDPRHAAIGQWIKPLRAALRRRKSVAQRSRKK